MAEAGEVRLAGVEPSRSLRRIAEASIGDGDGGDGDDVGMGIRAVDALARTGVGGAAAVVGAGLAAVARGEEHVGARRDQAAGDLIERMVGVGAVVLGRADRGVFGAVEHPPAVVHHPAARIRVHPFDEVGEGGDRVRQERRPRPRLGSQQRVVVDLGLRRGDAHIVGDHRPVIGLGRARHVVRPGGPAAGHGDAAAVDAGIDDGHVDAFPGQAVRAQG